MAKKIRYLLEIYEPGSVENVWVYFESDSPFLPFSVGDIVNPGTWAGTKSPAKVLKVQSVEHIIWENENEIKHKLMVFTKEVRGTRQLRIPNKR